MREFKFRVWSWHTNSFQDIDIEDIGMVFSGADGLEAQQFTGLKDKNGKEIYEGDWIKGQDYEQPVQVVFRNGQFASVYANMDLPFEACYSAPNKTIQMTVVGNIFENPELMKKYGKI